MPSKDDFTLKVKNKCKKLGLDVFGFADPNNYQKYKDYPEWNRPEKFLPHLKTVIVVGIHLDDIILDTWFQSSNGNYQFADMIIENKCYKLKEFLIDKGYAAEIISYTPGLFLKDSAALAGIGPIGKHNLLITKEFGSQVRLRALVTDAPLICGEPVIESDFCKNCDLCIKACPVDALKGGKYNKSLCETYQLNNLKKLSNHSSIWCNLCIKACPIGSENRK
ncbi:MAG: epoxyqueuosine reductase [Promethearchaeota archaeon]|nr:MAG: epoxyqueuosine reductase [Candidatus Lokiarchaeota archaeon]